MREKKCTVVAASRWPITILFTCEVVDASATLSEKRGVSFYDTGSIDLRTYIDEWCGTVCFYLSLFFFRKKNGPTF